MHDLEALFEAYKIARIRYPQERAKAEDAFFRGLIDEIAALKVAPPPVMPYPVAEAVKRGPGRPPKLAETANG